MVIFHINICDSVAVNRRSSRSRRSNGFVSTV